MTYDYNVNMPPICSMFQWETIITLWKLWKILTWSFSALAGCLSASCRLQKTSQHFYKQNQCWLSFILAKEFALEKNVKLMRKRIFSHLAFSCFPESWPEIASCEELVFESYFQKIDKFFDIEQGGLSLDLDQFVNFLAKIRISDNSII